MIIFFLRLTSTKTRNGLLVFQSRRNLVEQKNPRRLVLLINMLKTFNKKMERIMELCATSNKQFEKMSTFFDCFNAADDNKPHILEMIMNLPNLSKENAIRAFGIISASKGKTDSFLLMPDEEAKLIYISAVL
ncbi:unnamed protein product, partial [Cuscuta epithymum]